MGLFFCLSLHGGNASSCCLTAACTRRSYCLIGTYVVLFQSVLAAVVVRKCIARNDHAIDTIDLGADLR